MEKSDLENVLSGLLASIDRENNERFEAVASNPAVQAALTKVRERDVDGFYFALLYPVQKAIDGLLASELPGNHKAQFLFRHGSFVEQHFKRLFDKHDGMFACADKARTVISSLLRFFLTGKEIAFNYDGEYTYHLPNRILRTHAQIVGFFDGLYSLYYGNPTQYLAEMQALEQDLTTSEQLGALKSSGAA